MEPKSLCEFMMCTCVCMVTDVCERVCERVYLFTLCESECMHVRDSVRARECVNVALCVL